MSKLVFPQLSLIRGSKEKEEISGSSSTIIFRKSDQNFVDLLPDD